ncbi:nicotinate phosphoribosyltransferase [Actinobacillus pleuropneumoniae]|nr:nicotinate phosphoribosyltransferase [Actinobacillus pleuropneumoniae]
MHYIESLRFSDEDIAYLAKQEEKYKPEFLEELRRFRFQGNIHSMKEGALVFPNEPLIRVEGTIFETQLVETALLNFMNFQTLIATKASRIRQVAGGDTLLEFGTRRAQEADAAVWEPVQRIWPVPCHLEHAGRREIRYSDQRHARAFLGADLPERAGGI